MKFTVKSADSWEVTIGPHYTVHFPQRFFYYRTSLWAERDYNDNWYLFLIRKQYILSKTVQIFLVHILEKIFLNVFDFYFIECHNHIPQSAPCSMDVNVFNFIEWYSDVFYFYHNFSDDKAELLGSYMTFSRSYSWSQAAAMPWVSDIPHLTQLLGTN